jgi:hypothetical protein
VGSIKYVSIAVLAAILCMSISIYPVSAEEYTVVSRGEPFNISATLLSNGTSGIPLPNQVVFFFDQTMNSLMASTKTDSNGIASLDFSFPISHPLGNTLVNITFMGNTTLALAPTCQWLTLILTSLTNIELSTPKTNFAPNDNLEFVVHLTDDIANPVDSANLTILRDGIPILDTYTNETGYAFILIPLNPLEFSLGHHTIEVRYEGNPILFYRGTSSSFEIDINRISTNIEILTVTDTPTMLTETWSTTLQVMTEEGHLTMEPIRILIDGTYYDSVNIDSEGNVQSNLFINQSFSIGEHIITFEYLGNERYSSCLVELVVNIGSSIHLNITTLSSAEIGQNLTLEINALDAYLRPLSSGILEIRDTSTNQSIEEQLSSQTTTIVQFPIFGERGPRILQVEVTDGNLLSNNTIFLNLDIWTRPVVEIISSNILGFASPQQIMTIDVKLQDYRGSLPDKVLQFFLSNTNETSSIVTQIDGSARIEVQSPSIEGNYFLYILFEGNQSDFELSCQGAVSFIVSQMIPIEVMLHDYEIITPLSSILVRLQIQALNGSYLEGVSLQYSWISTEGQSPSGSDGITELYLSMPSASGIHSLYYEVEPIEGLQACSGIIYIITTSEDANASQGIGLYGLFLGFASSLGLTMIPVARRRLLIG